MKSVSKCLFCIGDSHVSVFLGKDKLASLYPQRSQSIIRGVEVVRLEGILAFNLPKYNTTTNGREKLEEQLKTIPPQSFILISAGEVDCRVHLIKQAIKQQKSYEEVADILVAKYIDFISQFTNIYKIGIILLPPTSYLGEDKIDKQYPRYGSEIERNKMTLIVNNKLKSYCTLKNIYTIGVSDSINRNGTTEKKYLWDGIHYSTFALPSLLRDLNVKTNLNIKLPYYWWPYEILRRIKMFIKKQF